MANQNQPIIIKKIKKADHGHHGGAWKIAYADFVTAMMAFFLLMWLINMTTVEQKQGLAEYFAPAAISESTSGSGGPMGGTSLEDAGSLKSGYSPKDTARAPSSPTSVTGTGKKSDAQGRETGKQSPIVAAAYESAAASVRQAMRLMPEVTPFQDNVLIEVTEDGIRIVIMDSEWRPMFERGSKMPLEPTRALMAAIAPVLQKLSADVVITGHVSAGLRYGSPDYGAWELSSDRANAVRSILTQSGLSEAYIQSVTGKAGTEPFFVDDPYMAANDRVTLSVLIPPPPVPEGLTP